MIGAALAAIILLLLFNLGIWFMIIRTPDTKVKLTGERMLELATKLQAHRANKRKKRLEDVIKSLHDKKARNTEEI